MTSIFERRLAKQAGVKPKADPKNGSVFERRAKETPQSIPEYASRTAGAAATGYATGTPYGIASNLINFLALGDVNDPEEMERIRQIAEREGVPFDEEKYKEAGQQALASFPTPSNIARMTEEASGLPITAKDKLQKAIELGATAGRGIPGSLSQKVTASVTAPASKEILEEFGVPEPIAELGGLGISGIAASKAPSIGLKATTKESGLKTRGFESLKKSREVSESRLGKINESLESDFKNISDKIISSSPIQDIKTTLAENPGFKQEVQEQFKTVEALAQEIPNNLDATSLLKRLKTRLEKNKGTGITASEYQEDFENFLSGYIKKTNKKEISAADLVKQYRENNRQLGEYYDPSKSRAYNRAKKDALLEYNQAIGETIEQEFPDTEFGKLFPETNSKWTQIMDAEAIEEFTGSLFEGKINYKEARKFFENENLARPFKRSLGKEAYKKFETLVSDLLKSETPYKMLQVAKKKGFVDLFKHGIAYMIHPKIGAAKSIFTVGKAGIQSIKNMLLDKPELTFVWEEGIKALKKGDFETANEKFNLLEKERSFAEKSFKEKARIISENLKKEAQT